MALKLAPDNREALFWAAQYALNLKQLDKREYASRGIRSDKTDVRMYLTLADIEDALGQPQGSGGKAAGRVGGDQPPPGNPLWGKWPTKCQHSKRCSTLRRGAKWMGSARGFPGSITT